MDRQSERWPPVDIVREELRQLQAEKTASEVKARAAHFAELKQHMSGHDKARLRIERRRSMRVFTERMLKIGERIINERQANSPLGD
jgi:hypothetical protein